MATRHAGSRIRREGGAVILVVGHGAGKYLWGSERSLLDVLDGFQAINIDVVVVVPPGVRENQHYLRALCARACAVHIEALPWRRCGQAGNGMVVQRLSEIIAEHQVSAVHVNTVVLREPLLAARQCGVPAVVHARELLHGNAEVCGWLAGDAENLVSEILADADFLIANSRATAYAYPLRGRTFVVPNIIDSTRSTPRLHQGESAPRVVLAGRLIATKGIEEFRLLASQLGPRCDARFIAVGPASPVTMTWAREELPGNLQFVGYMASPENIMAQADIVVSMSTVVESFGRTLVEAMAAGLPVVAWKEGGPAEIVVHGETGFLVPPGDLEAFARAVHMLCTKPELRQRMGRAGRRRVEDHFSPTQLEHALREAYRTILPDPEVVTESREIRRLALPTENRSHFKHPFFVGCRARFAHCTDVVFLDERTLITVSLLGRRAYLVNFDPATGSSAIVAEVPTAAFDAECSVDLLDADSSGRIVMADCEQQSVTLYRRVGNTLSREKTVRVPAGGYCHGVCFIPGEPDRVAVSVTSGDIGVHVVSLTSGCIEWSIRLPGWRPKSAAFPTSHRAIVAWVRDNAGDRPGAPHDGQLTMMRRGGKDFSMELVVSRALPGRSVDGLRMVGDRVFEPDQIKDLINEWRVDETGFHLEQTYRGFSFPHGVGVSPDGAWLAVAEYGTNAIAFRKLAPKISFSDLQRQQVPVQKPHLPPPYVMRVESGRDSIPEGVFFSVEAPLPNAISEGLVVEVAGWFAQTERCALPAPEKIAVFVDGELWLTAPIDMPRPDVGPAVLRDTGGTVTTDRNGFSFLLPVHLSARADAVYELAALHGSKPRALYSMVSIRFEPELTPQGDSPRRGQHRLDALTPVLVTSLGRSGSSLLCRMMAAHPECYVGRGGGQFGELRVLEFVTRLMMVASSEGSLAGLNPFEVEEDFKMLLPPAFPSTLVGGGDNENACERALWPVMTAQATSFSETVVSNYFENIRACQPGARFLVEKCWNSASVNALNLLCGTVREIFLVRHPRDLLRSESAFARKLALNEEAQRARSTSLAHRYCALARAWRDRRAQACLVRYEDLLTAPEETLSRLLRYLGAAKSDQFVTTAVGMVGDDSAHASMLRTSPSAPEDVEFEIYLGNLDEDVRCRLMRAATDWGYE